MTVTPIRLAAVAFFTVLLLVPAQSQVVLEDTVATESIDLFAAPQEKQPATLAMIASLVVPGLGHEILGRPQQALAYFAADAAFIFAMAYAERSSRMLFANAKTYAFLHANATGGTGANDYYWEKVGQFMDAEEYNRVLELNRTEDISSKKYVQDSLQWRWDDESSQQEYNKIRRASTRYHIVSSFFIAAMVIDRIVAFLDVRMATRYQGIRSAERHIQIRPAFSADFSRISIIASSEF